MMLRTTKRKFEKGEDELQKKNKVDRIKKTEGESELDVRLKEFWRQNDHFADLINAVVFHGRQRIAPEMLVEQDTDVSGVVMFSEYDEALRRSHDVVKKLALGTEFQVWSVENQKKVHFAMPLRAMIYDAMGYLKEYKALVRQRNQDRVAGRLRGETSQEFLSGIGKKDRLHPQLSIVLYYGEKRWDGPFCLKDMMTPFSDETESLFFDYGINLVQIIDNERYVFHNEAVRTVFEGAGALLRGDLDFISKNYNKPIPAEEAILIALISGSDALQVEAERKGNVNMCTALERLAEENRQRGIAQGIERGIAQGRCEERDITVKALLLQGLLPEQKIAEAMKISLEKLQEIKKKCGIE